MKRLVSGPERALLGLDAPISRRDFLNGSLAAGGALALPAASVAADHFTGYGGVGDYARANGNTWPVVQAAHRLRDGGYSEAVMATARDAGEFELVVVGGGIAGLSAAHRFRTLRGATARILILENHAMPGGEARQNEFDVEGIRLLGVRSRCAERGREPGILHQLPAQPRAGRVGAHAGQQADYG